MDRSSTVWRAMLHIFTVALLVATVFVAVPRPSQAQDESADYVTRVDMVCGDGTIESSTSLADTVAQEDAQLDVKSEETSGIHLAEVSAECLEKLSPVCKTNVEPCASSLTAVVANSVFGLYALVRGLPKDADSDTFGTAMAALVDRTLLLCKLPGLGGDGPAHAYARTKLMPVLAMFGRISRADIPPINKYRSEFQACATAIGDDTTF